MKITDYTTQTEDSGSITVYLLDKVVSRGFSDMESAMHSVFVMEGKVKGHFYHEKNRQVYLEVREEAENDK